MNMSVHMEDKYNVKGEEGVADLGPMLFSAILQPFLSALWCWWMRPSVPIQYIVAGSFDLNHSFPHFGLVGSH